MRQFHIFFNQAMNWHRIVCWFLCFYMFLPVFAWYDHNIVLQIRSKQNNFMITSCRIKKQSDLKFWLNWRKYETVSYSFSCRYFNSTYSVAYFLFFNVLLLCFNFSMVSFGRPLSFNFLLRSLMLRDANSSSETSVEYWLVSSIFSRSSRVSLVILGTFGADAVLVLLLYCKI